MTRRFRKFGKSCAPYDPLTFALLVLFGSAIFCGMMPDARAQDQSLTSDDCNIPPTRPF